MFSLLHPTKAIERFRQGTLSEAALFRSLMAFDGWFLPTQTDSDGAPSIVSFQSGEGRRRLLIFTDEDAIETCLDQESLEFGDQCLLTNGTELFWSVENSFATIEINPHSPAEMVFVSEQIPKLKQWARSVMVETALSTVDVEETPLGFLKDFDGYIVVLRKVGDGAQMVLAPDNQGRQLAAVFTAEDTLEAFLLDILSVTEFEPLPIRLNGNKLFRQILEMPVEGVVFNCCGPVTARAFGKKLAEYVLSAEEPL
ncbi:MAG: SseB family protein [Blastocatellia bacterium]|nr:SseB family protein [Blastocatellia bacterium]